MTMQLCLSLSIVRTCTYIIIIGDNCTIINYPHTLYLIQLGSNWHSCWYSYSLIGYTRTSKSINYYLIVLGSV